MAKEGRMNNYLNTPLCMNGSPFSERYGQISSTPFDTSMKILPVVMFVARYFGEHYGRLLEVKEFWDPDNFINHCHSVGSSIEDCCI